MKDILVNLQGILTDLENRLAGPFASHEYFICNDYFYLQITPESVKTIQYLAEIGKKYIPNFVYNDSFLYGGEIVGEYYNEIKLDHVELAIKVLKRTLRLQVERKAALLPLVGGLPTPKYIKCYDDGKGQHNMARYTVVFTGNYKKRTGGKYQVLMLPVSPYDNSEEVSLNYEDKRPDRPSHAQLGGEIDYESLPMDCKSYIMEKYCEIWGLS